ncbi:low temperature requirement protein A [Microbacterium protaetiae]|uniref:Low temperature requirement protein A n=1 Tax=Microbacterium protaetiae TaxID=2509458 RepID=A0A4P6EIV7_9MICO|nr:low temperature requirement protein A [Microbacterium protaetiae]QAY61219.1 low temperature requirement protein A [Microbacterium protaetiae]
MSAQKHPPAGRRVHWLELLFDLAMVAYIGQIAHTMHGDPTLVDGVVFAVLLAAAWWAWINASVTMNLFGARVTPVIWISVIIALMAIGFMAAAVPEALTARNAAFALGNAVIRVVWMLPWLMKRRSIGVVWWRPWLYCLVPAALWTASIWAGGAWRYLLWALALVIEITLLTRLGSGASWLRRTLDVDHLVERVSLLVVIVFGESVLSIITELDEHWAPATWLAALLGFVAVAILAWVFFSFATGAVELGLHRLQGRGSVEGLRDTVMYLPFLLIAGVVLFASGVGTAVADAAGRLPFAAAVCLAGGVSLYFLSSTAESLRYGAPWRDVVMWGPAGIVVPWLLVPAAAAWNATGVLAAAVGVVAVLGALNAVNARRVSRAGAAVA